MRGTALAWMAVAAGTVASAAGFAQDAPRAAAGQPPGFDAASVKVNASGERQRSVGFQPGGRFVARNMTLRGLVAAAYGAPPLPLYRVVGGPGWVDADRFDIDATLSADPARPAQAGWSVDNQQRLRGLLADRFRLVVRQESQELPAYALIAARSDRRLGARLTASPSCDDAARPPGAPRSPLDPPPCGGFGFSPPDRLTGRHLTMNETARFIMLNAVDRPVLNRTELPGAFDWSLEFTREAPAGAPVGPAEPGAAGAVSQAPSIFTALQEQLGLKLEPIRSRFDVVVIASVARPDPD
jgi:uncharacterized protein (TIGR03435 family)